MKRSQKIKRRTRTNRYGKRILVALLSALMLFDSVSVSAMTVSGGDGAVISVSSGDVNAAEQTVSSGDANAAGQTISSGDANAADQTISAGDAGQQLSEASDIYLSYQGKRLYDAEQDIINSIPYDKQDIVIDIYKGDSLLTTADAEVTITDKSPSLEDAVSVVTDDGGVISIQIDKDLIYDWSQDIMTFSLSETNAVYFSLSIYDKVTEATTEATYYMLSEESEEGIVAADFYLSYGEEKLRTVEQSGLNYVSYEDGDLVFGLYNGEQLLTTADAEVAIAEYDAMLADAITIENDGDNQLCVRIEADKVKDVNGDTVGLSGLDSESLYFKLQITDLEFGNTVYQSYRLAQFGVLLEDAEGTSAFLKSGVTWQLPMNEVQGILLQELAMLPEDVAVLSVTSSNTAVLGLHGTLEAVEANGSFHSTKCFMEPKKKGSSTVKIKYSIGAATYTKSFVVKVVAESTTFSFGYWDEEETFVPFTAGETLEIEQGQELQIYTSISPRLLSGIKLTSSNSDILKIAGTISESFVYEDALEHAYIDKTGATLVADSENTGQATLTMTAKYAGKTYTKKVTFTVTEPKGLQLKEMHLQEDGQEYEAEIRRVTKVSLDRYQQMPLFGIYDENDQGETVAASAADYTFTFQKYDEVTESYIASTDFSIEYVTDSVFYIVPDIAGLAEGDDSHRLVISPLNAEGEADTVTIPVSYKSRSGIYLSYDEAAGLTLPVNTVNLTEGEEHNIYFKTYAGYGSDFRLADAQMTAYGCSVSGTEIVGTEAAYGIEDYYNIIKVTILWDGSNPASDLVSLQLQCDYPSGAVVLQASLYEVPEGIKKVPVATLKQLSTFVNAEGSDGDISHVRIGDYEVQLLTQADGSKGAILTGYLGREEEILLPKYLEVASCVDIASELEHAMTLNWAIPVLGCENGVFDSAEGYGQPAYVYVRDSYTYFGEGNTGWINPTSAVRTEYRYAEGSGSDRAFAISGGMLFGITEDGYICIDTGNMNTAAVVDGVVVLYRNRTAGSTAVNLIPSDNVQEYNLKAYWLYDSAGKEIPVYVGKDEKGYSLRLDNSHADAALIPELESGNYYMKLVPVVAVEEQSVELGESLCKVQIVFDTKVPEVTAQGENTLNTYFGDEAAVPLEISNSFETAVTNITITGENHGLSVRQNEEGNWLLGWDGITEIPENAQITLQYAVEGFSAEGGEDIAPQTIAVKAVKTQPTTALSASTLTFSEYPYTVKDIAVTVKNNDYRDNVTIEAQDITLTSAPKGAVTSDITFAYEEGQLSVDVGNNAVKGTYKYKLTPRVGAGEKTAKAVTLTVSVKGNKPAVKFTGTSTVTLNNNFYNTIVDLSGLTFTAALGEALSEGVICTPENNENSADAVRIKTTVKSKPKKATGEEVTLAVTYAEEAESRQVTDSDGNVYAAYAIEDISLKASVTRSAPTGSYVLNIAVPTIVDGDLVWMSVTATVKVVNTLPAAKLASTSVTLDAAYPGDYTVTTKLVMNDGYTLNSLEVKEPGVNAAECIAVTYDATGTICFDLVKAGLSKAGTYKVTPVLQAPGGELITMKTMSIAVKVTNSSKAMLYAKSKSVTLNPYVGSATVKAQLTRKGFTEQEGVTYTSEYLFVPTNGNEAVGNTVTLSVDESTGAIVAETTGMPANGKYTYNLVEKLAGTDGTVTYTKPIAFTVQVAAKKLTVVPEKTSLTLYQDYCTTTNVALQSGESLNCYRAELPVSIKELPDASVPDYIVTEQATDNSMSSQGVMTCFTTKEDTGGTVLVITFPTTLSNLKGLKITPEGLDTGNVGYMFNSFSVNLTVKTGAPMATFEQKAVVLNRYTDIAVENTLQHTEGYRISGMELVSVKNDNADLSDNFTAVAEENVLSLAIKENYVDTIANGTYTVTVIPMVSFETGETTVMKTLEPCSFSLKLEQPEVTIKVTEEQLFSKTVNLYPELGEVTSESFEVSAIVDGEVLAITKVELVTDDSNRLTTYVNHEDNRRLVTFSALANEAGGYVNGSNAYNANVYVTNKNGSAEVLAGTLNKAFVVNVRDLPTDVGLTSTNISFSPYLQAEATTAVKSAELEALTATGDYQYEITVKETDSEYVELAEELQNDILTVEESTAEDGRIVITTDSYPEKNAVYYYRATVALTKTATDEGTGESADETGGESVGAGLPVYTVQFKVTVKSTLPTTALKQTSITLNNAYVSQEIENALYLSSGGGLWTLEALVSQVKNSKNQDVTNENYFNIVPVIEETDGETCFTGRFTVSLNGQKNGTPFNVPKGTYKIILMPKVKAVTSDGTETVIGLAAKTLTVKVISSRPAVKYSATKLTVNTYTNEVSNAKLTLSNGGIFDAQSSLITCTKYPKGAAVNEGVASGVHLSLEEDGTLQAYADRNAVPGTYTYKVQPVTLIEGNSILLDTKNVSVAVKDTKPTAKLSTSTSTLNTLFADSYSAEIIVSAKNAGDYAYCFDKTAIVTLETNAAKKSNAGLLLEQMSIQLQEDGTAKLVLKLPDTSAGVTIPNGTYKFKLTPSLHSGNERDAEDAYALKAVSFSVKVESKKPTVSARVAGSIDTLHVSEGITCQISMNKQAYDTVHNITYVKLLDKSTGAASTYFYIDGPSSDGEAGKYVIRAYDGGSLNAEKSYALQLEAVSSTGQVYIANMKIKVIQSSYKVNVPTAYFYTEINNGRIALEFSASSNADNICASAVTIADVSADEARDSFTCRLVSGKRNTVEIWTTQDLSEVLKKGETIYITLEVSPQGLAANKKPVQVKVPVKIK